MENRFTVIIVEDARLELKGTEEIFRTEIPEAEIIGTASNENELNALLKEQVPQLLLLDLGLGGSTTVGVEICARIKKEHPEVKVLVFTGELLDENLWVLRRIAEDVGINWKSSWDTYINTTKSSKSYANDAARFKAIGKYLTDATRLGYVNNNALWSKIYSMCDMMFKYGGIKDAVGSNETNKVPASGVLGTWETIELYTK